MYITCMVIRGCCGVCVLGGGGMFSHEYLVLLFPTSK
jgi:hypothetical protein